MEIGTPGMTTTSLTDEYVTRLIEIARAYYHDNATQADIATMFNMSRSMVSRDLTLARELGIVEITIKDPRQRVLSYRERLLMLFPHLRDAIIAPTFSLEIDAVRATLGRFAANYLLTVLQPDQRLVLGCGRTLRAMTAALAARRLPNVQVVQAMGNIGHEAHGIDYNEIARQVAAALDGRAYYLSAPAILGPKGGSARDFVEVNATLSHALALGRTADVAVVGLGSLESDQLYAQAGLITPAEMEALRRDAVGDICARFFNLNGQVVQTPFDYRVVGLELADIRNTPIAIGVAGGLDKVDPIIGALRGQHINVLVSDERTVRAIIEKVAQASYSGAP